MKRLIALCTILVVLLVQSNSYGEMRNFRGTNGKVIEAEYISFDKDTDTVKIRLKDGREQKVKIARFSEEDQAWIKNGGKENAPVEDTPKPADAKETVQYSENEQAEIDKFCAANGTDVKALDKDGLALLHKAARSEGPAVVKFLLEKGADIQAKHRDGYTPLHFSARNPNIETAKFLVSRGADLNAKGEQCGATPLHEAAWNSNAEFAGFLIEKGADINAKHNWGGTPLHCAIGSPNAEVVKLLVEKAADINVKNDDGMTALDLAKKANDANAVKYLEEKGAKVGEKTNNVPVAAVQVPVAVAPAPAPVCAPTKIDGFLPAGSLEKQIDNGGKLLEDGKDCIANLQRIGYLVCIFVPEAKVQTYQVKTEQNGIETRQRAYTVMRPVWEHRIKESPNYKEMALQNNESVLKKVATYVEQCPDEIPMVKNYSVAKIFEWNIDDCQTPEKNYDAICSVKCESALSAMEYVRLLLERSALLKKHGSSKDAEKCAALAMYCLQGIMEYEISRLHAPAGGSCDTACNNNSCEPNSNSCGQNAQRNQMLSWLKSEMECKTNIASALHLYGIAATLSNADETLKKKVDQCGLLLNKVDPASTDDQRIDLTWAEWISARVGHELPMRGRAPEKEGKVLQVGGKIFESGLWAHAVSSYKFNLGGRWKSLKCGYGNKDGKKIKTPSVVFVVRGDDKELFRSELIADDQLHRLELDVTGVQCLDLIVEDSGDGCTSDWGVWIEPILER